MHTYFAVGTRLVTCNPTSFSMFYISRVPITIKDLLYAFHTPISVLVFRYEADAIKYIQNSSGAYSGSSGEFDSKPIFTVESETELTFETRPLRCHNDLTEVIQCECCDMPPADLKLISGRMAVSNFTREALDRPYIPLSYVAQHGDIQGFSDHHRLTGRVAAG